MIFTKVSHIIDNKNLFRILYIYKTKKKKKKYICNLNYINFTIAEIAFFLTIISNVLREIHSQNFFFVV